MSTSKNTKVTVVTLTLANGKGERVFVAANKDAATRFLYTQAVQNWRTAMPSSTKMPNNRKAIVDMFFNDSTGNRCELLSATSLPTSNIVDSQRSADAVVNKLHPKMKVAKKKTATVGAK